MPRLRYLKSKRLEYEYESQPDESPNEATFEGASGQSWLSNASIIASFTDQQLSDAIRRYKNTILLLETEVRTRALSVGASTHKRGLLDNGQSRKRSRKPASAGNKRSPEIATGSDKVQAVVNAEKFIKKMGIKSEDASKLLATWIKIIAEKGE